MNTEKSLLTLRSEEVNTMSIKSALTNNNHINASVNDDKLRRNMLLCAEVCNMIASMY